MSAPALLPRAARLRRGPGRDPGPVPALHADPPGRADGHLPPPARAVPDGGARKRSRTRSSSRAPTAPAPTAPITAPTARLWRISSPTRRRSSAGDLWRFDIADGRDRGSPSPTAPSRPASVGRTSPSAIPIVGMLRAVSTLVFGREGEARETECAACGADACRFEARPAGGNWRERRRRGTFETALGPDRVADGRRHPGAQPRRCERPRPDAARRPRSCPRSTEEVSAALKICHAHRRPVVTQGRPDGACRRRAPEGRRDRPVARSA